MIVLRFVAALAALPRATKGAHRAREAGVPSSAEAAAQCCGAAAFAELVVVATAGRPCVAGGIVDRRCAGGVGRRVDAETAGSVGLRAAGAAAPVAVTAAAPAVGTAAVLAAGDL